HPTPLPAGLPIHLAQGLPKPQRPSANGQGWRVLQPVTLEVEQKVFPGLLTLSTTIPEPDEFFVALGISTNNDEETMPRVLQAGLEVDPIDPEIDIPFALETAAFPLCQFVVPPLFQ